MVQDLVHNLCESLMENIDGVAGIGKKTPTPIYLTQWKIVGNSEVHTDPYLTSWKVSGNSVVDNNTILSCGDLGQDGKYHVKISNGVDIYDIALNEPLRKVHDVADTIEFPSGTEGKALVTRPLKSINLYDYIDSISLIITDKTSTDGIYAYSFGVLSDALPPSENYIPINGLCSAYIVGSRSNTYNPDKKCISINKILKCHVYDPDFDGADDIDAFKAYITEVKPEFIYELATPTTELVDAPQIAVSPTDTYISANATPYSAFEHTENKEIWSCGEYNSTDGKYHILVQPQGGSVADIALDEPLRKVNDVADTIEFPSNTEGKALVTRNLKSVVDMSTLSWVFSNTTIRMYVAVSDVKTSPDSSIENLLCPIYPTISNEDTKHGIFGIAVQGSPLAICVYDENYITSDSVSDFLSHVQGISLIYQLATPTTELVDAPQIAEAESYSCVISQGGKAISWSSFETE